jgi:hypothetical protein
MEYCTSGFYKILADCLVVTKFVAVEAVISSTEID